MTDAVWVSSSKTIDAEQRECDVVVPLWRYDADLGMPTRRYIVRQLEVDVPRSVVLVNGRRVRRASDVLRATAYPRLCTQAVLAPPVEWLCRAGFVAHEVHPLQPMVVDVRCALLRVSKRLGLRRMDDGRHCGVVDILLHADLKHGSVVVTLLRRKGPADA